MQHQISDRPIISATGLVKFYGKQAAVNNMSFEVLPGECFGLLGPNGAGKTTTMRLLLGLAKPNAGNLTVLNLEMPKYAATARKRIGVVPQHNNLDPDFSVIENLRIYANYFGLRGKALEDRIYELLVFAALETRANTKITALSGGMKRRLILARALLNQPELLILDEPTTGLDPQARLLIWQRLRELQHQGTTLIITTHYLEEAERLCDRVVVMEQGAILALGTPKELIAQYIEPQVFEIRGEGVHEWYQQQAHLNKWRLEMIGESVFCYCRDTSILEELKRWPALEFIHRPANLEDVFLKLTGRELRDA